MPDPRRHRRDDLLAHLAGGRRLPRPVAALGVGGLVFMTVWGFVRSLT